MATPFDFLTAEIPAVHESAVWSGAKALGGARVSCFHTRLAAESAIKWAFEFVRSPPRPCDSCVGTQPRYRSHAHPVPVAALAPASLHPTPLSVVCTRPRTRPRHCAWVSSSSSADGALGCRATPGESSDREFSLDGCQPHLVCWQYPLRAHSTMRR